MERIRQTLHFGTPYEHIDTEDVSEAEVAEEERNGVSDLEEEQGFSWLNYAIFLLSGVAMLWAWYDPLTICTLLGFLMILTSARNMFLAAGPYFIRRFRSNEWILEHFQSVELSVSSIALLSSVYFLSQLQENANYPRRVLVALVMNIVTFTMLAISTKFYINVSSIAYFVFLIFMVLLSSLAAGLMQNGIFAYVASFGVERYIQGIMTGQAIAGVLPAIIQIIAATSVSSQAESDQGPRLSSTSAFSYFLTATGVSVVTLLAFMFLIRCQDELNRGKISVVSSVTLQPAKDNLKMVPFKKLFRELYWFACAVFLTFAVTMFFPVFTQKIVSVQPVSDAPRLLRPESFIPLAFFFWNLGDLIGRLLTAVARFSLTSAPRTLFLFAVARVAFVPLYLLCNVRGKGALVHSDSFYLGFVQLFFGVSNGFVGSSCMMAAGQWVGLDEREAAGAFMGFCLVAGLSMGSLLSFTVAGV